MDRIVIPMLEAERPRLRAFRRSDFEDYAALRADAEVLCYLDFRAGAVGSGALLAPSGLPDRALAAGTGARFASMSRLL